MLDQPPPTHFTDPAMQSQAGFQAVMQAMSRPGTIVEAPVPLEAPTPLNPVAAMVALTLCDYDTPVWLDPVLAESADLKSWLAFYTGAPLARTRKEACFAFISSSRHLGDLSQFAQGTDTYPDRSTTLIVQAEAVSNSAGARLSGPGIETATTLGISPLPDKFWSCARANNALFPRGVDLVFCTRVSLACLPRSTRIAEGG